MSGTPVLVGVPTVEGRGDLGVPGVLGVVGMGDMGLDSSPLSREPWILPPGSLLPDFCNIIITLLLCVM